MWTKILYSQKDKALACLLSFTAIAVIAPLFGNQFISGPIVNASLFITTALLGLQAGIFLSFLPSLIALSVGFMPMVMLPMITFIIIGNIIMVATFHFTKKNNYWKGVFLASFLKFAFLYISSSFVVEVFNIPARAAIMMSWPQLVTALSGGILAFSYLHFRKDGGRLSD